MSPEDVVQLLHKHRLMLEENPQEDGELLR
jgi:hypothetical protein